MDEDDVDLFVVSEEEAGQRIDKILAERYEGKQSRSYFQKLLDEEQVLINGRPVKKRILPKAGDEVEVHFSFNEELSMAPEDIPLDVLFEDEQIIVVNKPAGMVVHPAPGNWSGTFVNALLHHCRGLPGLASETVTIRPGIVHRLDKETSGVLIAAKTTQAQQRLTSLFSGREVYKEYLAICVGSPGTGEIDAPIGRHPIERKKMAVVQEGRAALTEYNTVGSKGELSLVRLVLKTGRTHQIRVHMRHKNAAVLGDSLYGNMHANRKFHADRQLLHAYKLRLVHPMTGKVLEFVAPIPEDMAGLLNKLGISP